MLRNHISFFTHIFVLQLADFAQDSAAVDVKRTYYPNGVLKLKAITGVVSFTVIILNFIPMENFGKSGSFFTARKMVFQHGFLRMDLSALNGIIKMV